MSTNQPRNYRCNSCRRRFPPFEEKTFKKHVRRCNNIQIDGEAHSCRVCSAQFDCDSQLVDHLDKDCLLIKKRCHYCKNSLHKIQHYTSLQRHAMWESTTVERKEGMLFCTCGKQFHTMDDLRKHIMKQSQISCLLCGFGFKTMKRMKDHLQTGCSLWFYTSQRDVVCNLCKNFKSNSESTIRDHVQSCIKIFNGTDVEVHDVGEHDVGVHDVGVQDVGEDVAPQQVGPSSDDKRDNNGTVMVCLPESEKLEFDEGKYLVKPDIRSYMSPDPLIRQNNMSPEPVIKQDNMLTPDHLIKQNNTLTPEPEQDSMMSSGHVTKQNKILTPEPEQKSMMSSGHLIIDDSMAFPDSQIQQDSMASPDSQIRKDKMMSPGRLIQQDIKMSSDSPKLTNESIIGGGINESSLEKSMMLGHHLSGWLPQVTSSPKRFKLSDGGRSAPL